MSKTNMLPRIALLVGAVILVFNPLNAEIDTYYRSGRWLSPFERLHQVIVEDDVTKLDELIQRDFKNDYDVQNETGWSPLAVASSCGSLNIIRHLLNQHASISTANAAKETPLHIACLQNNFKAVELLLNAAEADGHLRHIMDAEQIDDETPLFYAAKSSVDAISMLVAERLIEKGAQLDHINRAGMSAVHVAIVRDKVEFTKVLIQRGGDKVAKSTCCGKSGKTLSHLAAQCNAVWFLGEDLINHFDPSALDGFNQVPICSAAAAGSIEFARKMVYHFGASFDGISCMYDEENSITGTALHMAVFNYQLRFVELLLNSGANSLATDSTGGTALHALARQTSPRTGELRTIVSVLQKKVSSIPMIPQDALFKFRDFKGRDAMLLAAATSNEYFADNLMKGYGINIASAVDNNGATAFHLTSTVPFLRFLTGIRGSHWIIDSRTNNSLTPLLHAITQRKSADFIKILLELGADPRRENDEGFNAVFLAIRSNNLEALQALLEAGLSDLFLSKNGEINDLNSFQYAIEKRNDKAAAMIANALKSPTIANSRILTISNQRIPALHYAVRNNNFVLLKALVEECNAVISVVDSRNGRTVLHEAAQIQNAEIVEYLIKKEADVSAKDKNGRTPLHLAAVSGSKVANALLRAVDDHALRFIVDAVDNFDEMPLHHAVEHGNVEGVRLLISEFKANCLKLNKQGRSPLHVARDLGFDNLIDVMITANGTTCSGTETDACGKAMDIADSVICNESPVIPNGLTKLHLHNCRSVSAQATIQCDQGSTLVGSANVECDKNGRWIVNGFCAKDCGQLPTVENGRVQTGDFKVTSVRRIACSEGFTLKGNNTITCQPDSHWSLPGICREIDNETESAIPKCVQKSASLSKMAQIAPLSNERYYFRDWKQQTNGGNSTFRFSSNIAAILVVQPATQHRQRGPPFVTVVTQDSQVIALSRHDPFTPEWSRKVTNMYSNRKHIRDAAYNSKSGDIYFILTEEATSIYAASWGDIADDVWNTGTEMAYLLRTSQSLDRRFSTIAVDSDNNLLFACDYYGKQADVSIWLLVQKSDVTPFYLPKYLGSARKVGLKPMFTSFYYTTDKQLMVAISDPTKVEIHLMTTDFDLLVTNEASDSDAFTSFATVPATSEDRLIGPHEVLFDQSGNLLVTDKVNARLQVFSPPDGNAKQPYRLAWSSNSTVYNFWRVALAKNATSGSYMGLLASDNARSLIVYG